jgi:hypothetical protein
MDTSYCFLRGEEAGARYLTFVYVLYNAEVKNVWSIIYTSPYILMM